MIYFPICLYFSLSFKLTLTDLINTVDNLKYVNNIIINISYNARKFRPKKLLVGWLTFFAIQMSYSLLCAYNQCNTQVHVRRRCLKHTLS